MECTILLVVFVVTLNMDVTCGGCSTPVSGVTCIPFFYDWVHFHHEFLKVLMVGFQPILMVGIRPSKRLKINDGNVTSHRTMGYMSLQRLVYYNHHTLRPYSESLQTRPAILYIPYATSFHEQTGDIITFS